MAMTPTNQLVIYNSQLQRKINMNERNDDNYRKLIEAFEDEDFQKRINQYRHDIELQLNGFIEWLIEALTSNQKIFHSPESRIKSKISFQEKIYRKYYINKWNLDGSKQDIQDEILKNLPDVIGFRITCYFIDDEEVIYSKLQEYHGLHRFSDIALDFSEGTRQKNGKKIYKVSGKFKDTVCFELQIKAATHNVWGEVEHKTIYKGRQYSINHKERQTITGEIFNILRASDQQLLALFRNTYTQDDLVYALFAEQTRDRVKVVAKTEFLAGHYTSFFSIFLPEIKDNIWEYVSAALSNSALQYTKHELNVDSPTDDDHNIVSDIKSTFLEYYLKVQYQIAQELFLFKEYDDFLLYMAKTIKNRFATDVDGDFIEGDVFSEDEEQDAFDEGYSELVLKVLKDKLPDALRERE